MSVIHLLDIFCIPIFNAPTANCVLYIYHSIWLLNPIYYMITQDIVLTCYTAGIIYPPNQIYWSFKYWVPSLLIPLIISFVFIVQIWLISIINSSNTQWICPLLLPLASPISITGLIMYFNIECPNRWSPNYILYLFQNSANWSNTFCQYSVKFFYLFYYWLHLSG